ncbi:MAG: GntR family transcriptional regulator [Bacteroidales bacterium]|nr:GntR family transcriptional regulator [Bacteroidales bacterium]
MNFNDNKAIYLQIAEWVFEQILNGKWNEGDRIYSVREMGMALEVNPNTVLRAYDLLQQLEIVINKRGIGFFVSEDAKTKILNHRKKQFIENEVPVFFKTMKMLQMDWSEMEKIFREYQE